MLNSDLGVVCCYFNPCNYKKKHSNFIRFYESLSSQVSRIQVVELTFDDHSSLPDYVKPLTVKSKGPLWHKENLLNLGIDLLLAEGFENIAWLDSDVLFLDPSWAFDAVTTLEKYKICQLFSSSESFDHGGKPKYMSGCVRYWLESGNILPVNQAYSMGYGWAAKSEVLANCRLYDKSIIGGGDSLIWLSCFSETHNIHKIMEHHPITKLQCYPYYTNFIEWSELWGYLIEGSVFCTFNPIISLSHGSFSNRNYGTRYEILSTLNYNPAFDLYYNDMGVLESRKPELYRAVFNYLKNRNEDELQWLQKWLKT